jgi:hypothetical protein
VGRLGREGKGEEMGRGARVGGKGEGIGRRGRESHALSFGQLDSSETDAHTQTHRMW